LVEDTTKDKNSKPFKDLLKNYFIKDITERVTYVEAQITSKMT
jgi:hypothetical protein